MPVLPTRFSAGLNSRPEYYEQPYMTPIEALRGKLQDDRFVLIDGATGTELERRGAAMHHAAWCAMASLTEPDLLRQIHADYIRAGAALITANTFSTNRNMLEPAGLGDRFEELNRAAVRIALEARTACAAEGQVVVAGSMSHQIPVAARSDRRRADALPPPEVAKARFDEMANVLAEAGVDMILLEMMYDPLLANLAIDAVRRTGLPFWVGFSVHAADAGEPRAFSLPELSARQLFREISIEGAEAAGVMHSSVNVTGPAISSLREAWPGPLMAYPDSGYFRMPNWQFENIITPDALVQFARDWARSGVRIFGGCCGLGLEHIRTLARTVVA